MALTPSVLDTSVTWKVKDKLAMLLERLPREDLREEVRWIRFARNVLQLHAPSAAQLAHILNSFRSMWRELVAVV